MLGESCFVLFASQCNRLILKPLDILMWLYELIFEVVDVCMLSHQLRVIKYVLEFSRSAEHLMGIRYFDGWRIC